MNRGANRTFRARALLAHKPTPENSPEGFLWKVHSYTNEYIRFADAKAAFAVAASTTLIGAVVSSSVFDSCLRTEPYRWSKLLWIASAGLLLLLASIVFSVAAVKPRLWNRVSVGFIFWESVAGHRSAQSFYQAVGRLLKDDQITAVSDHIFLLAAIARRKYTYVNLAIWTGVAGGVLTAVAIFMKHALR